MVMLVPEAPFSDPEHANRLTYLAKSLSNQAIPPICQGWCNRLKRLYNLSDLNKISESLEIIEIAKSLIKPKRFDQMTQIKENHENR